MHTQLADAVSPALVRLLSAMLTEAASYAHTRVADGREIDRAAVDFLRASSHACHVHVRATPCALIEMDVAACGGAMCCPCMLLRAFTLPDRDDCQAAVLALKNAVLLGMSPRRATDFWTPVEYLATTGLYPTVLDTMLFSACIVLARAANAAVEWAITAALEMPDRDTADVCDGLGGCTARPGTPGRRLATSLGMLLLSLERLPEKQQALRAYGSAMRAALAFGRGYGCEAEGARLDDPAPSMNAR